MKNILLSAVLACLLSSCVVLPYDHGHYERWGPWHGEGGGRWR